MRLNRATIEDYESIIAFYNDVTDRTPDMERFARWIKGLHPTNDGIRAYIEEGSFPGDSLRSEHQRLAGNGCSDR